jgi:hypothetical protein
LVGSVNRLVGCARADGCGVYPDAYGQSLIPREDVFLIVGTGQQTLGGVIEI